MRRALGFALVALICATGVAYAAVGPKYITAPPLAQVVRTPVGPVKDTGCLTVPIITWGADIGTIFANGNSRKTVQGSIFSKEGLCVELVREDNPRKQLEMYLSGKTPFFRGTNGQINMMLEAASRDPKTVPVMIEKLSRSAGGDTLVVKSHIQSLKDIKVVALQAYGPHVEYETSLFQDAGIDPKNITVRWTEDIVGIDGNTPGAAFHDDSSVDAAFVLSSDAKTLTTQPAVPGTEGHVVGARTLLSTFTADTLIVDEYVVRSDYLAANREKVEKFVHARFLAEEQVKALFGNTSDPLYKPMITAAAEILFDSPKATGDAEDLYAGGRTEGWAANVKYFTDPSYSRGFPKMTEEVQTGLVALGLMSQRVPLTHANWDYSRLKGGLANTQGVEASHFNPRAVEKVMAQKLQQGTLKEGELFSFKINFEPQQYAFPEDLYDKEFDKTSKFAQKYGGAVMVIKGYADPLEYLRAKKNNVPDTVLRELRQSGRNTSLRRGNAVRDAVVAFAKNHGVTLDPNQFTVIGMGIDSPVNGTCGPDPCAPENEKMWRANMRVEFVIMQVEAEASVFRPL